MEKCVPDVLDTVPDSLIEIIYGDNLNVKPGIVLTPMTVKDEPRVSWPHDETKFYCLIMVDPDAPSNKSPKYREWLHWCVGNIPGTKVEEGQVIVQYVGAAPPRKTGLHRYIFVVYEQLDVVDYGAKHIPNTVGEGRTKFSCRNFASTYKLNIPIAANYFNAQWDSYVLTLYKQLGNH